MVDLNCDSLSGYGEMMASNIFPEDVLIYGIHPAKIESGSETIEIFLRIPHVLSYEPNDAAALFKYFGFKINAPTLGKRNENMAGFTVENEVLGISGEYRYDDNYGKIASISPGGMTFVSEGNMKMPEQYSWKICLDEGAVTGLINNADDNNLAEFFIKKYSIMLQYLPLHGDNAKMYLSNILPIKDSDRETKKKAYVSQEEIIRSFQRPLQDAIHTLNFGTTNLITQDTPPVVARYLGEIEGRVKNIPKFREMVRENKPRIIDAKRNLENVVQFLEGLNEE